MKKLFFLLFVCFFTQTAYGQGVSFPEFPFSITNPGIFEPGEGWLFQQNVNAPASLAYMKGMRLGVLSSETLKAKYERYDMSGETVFFSTPIPLIQMGFGASVDVMRSIEWLGSRFSFGLGSASSEMVSWGIRYSTIVSPGTSETNGLKDITFALRLNPMRYFNIAWQMENTLMYKNNSVPMDRIHRIEAVFGRNYKMYLGASVSERRRDFGFHGGFRMQIIDGVYLWGSASWNRLEREINLGQELYSYRIPPALRVDAGLSIVIDNMSLSMGGRGPVPGSMMGIIWEEKPVYTSIVPEVEYALMVDFSREYKEKDYALLVSTARRCLASKYCIYMIMKMEDNKIALSRVEEWSRIIEQFQKKSKKVLAYGFGYSNSSYALVAGADRIMIFPGGSVNLRGLSVTRYFAGEALKLIGLEYQFVRFGPWKSAVESYTQKVPSKENEDNMKSLLSSMDRNFRGLLKKRRGLDDVKIGKVLSTGTMTSLEAQSAGLVDHVIYPDQIGTASFRVTRKLAVLKNAAALLPQSSEGKGLAMLILEGEIVSKKSSIPSFIEQSEAIEVSKVISALNQAAADPKFKAIVIRINSPGGSAMASEVLWRRISNLSRLKPVIITFGEYATSGGYYIASGAVRIFAEPSTITGSIGIYGGKYNIKGLVDRLGVGLHTIKQSPYADMESKFRPYTPEEIKLLEKRLSHGYRSFLQSVATGRKIPLDQLKKFAEGRVFTGKDAVVYKLCDELGGINEAIDFARKKSGLSSKSPTYILYPPPPPIWKKLVKMTLGESIPVGSKVHPMLKGKYLSPSLFENGPWLFLMHRFSVH
ncbi:signal peptide peptidase SppA [Myxococcota bacterium]|nr:signal peptide peptidase SppA [Myxococcota bacterium]MBU1382241.1 signal peptide peptidase SppA [Myxococcota bacterium]MBU1496638.1 signal peptide peptidase SppA [Myxococcota bacterium]